MTTAAQIRKWENGDSLEELTALLHLAYRKNADAGMLFLASHQPVSVTADRIKKGVCFVAFHDGRMVGTITYYPPGKTAGCAWYERPGVASYGQFAVHPEFQNHGLGNRLMLLAEAEAKKERAAEIAIDTAETATELIRFYEKRGYRKVSEVRWREVNYRSVIMSKALF